MNPTPPKYTRVRDALARLIRSGKYTPGQKLPGERALAVEYGISYMTARRAGSELVQQGLLDRRPWEGLFVVIPASPNADSKLAAGAPSSTNARATATTTLNIITIGHEPPHVNTLKRLASKYADEQGWLARYVRIDHP